MKKILMILILGIFLISFISATDYYQTHGLTEVNKALDDDSRGILFYPNVNGTLKSATKFVNTTTSQFGIWDTNGTSLGNASLVGLNASFSINLVQGRSYVICSVGASTSAWYDGASTPPYNNTYINFTVGIYGSGTGTGCGSFATEGDGSLIREVAGLTFEPTAPSVTIINTTLISPSNNEVLTSSSKNFTSYYNMSGTNNSYVWKNTTYYVYHSNGTLFNSSTITLSGNQSIGTLQFNGIPLGSYFYYTNAYYSNATFVGNNFSTSNYTFSVGATINSISYTNNTYETSKENFIANFSIIEGSEISLAQLIYNGTKYTITNLTQGTTTISLQKEIDIPVNIYSLGNQTNNFAFRFTYGGGFVQDTNFSQNVSFINLQICNTTFHTQALNFTFINEINQTKLVGTSNPTNIEVGFKYWLGSGSVYKNYSFQNLSSSYVNYSFCIYPYNPNSFTFKSNMDMEYSATDFRENNYHLLNATLTNISSDINLYLIHTDYANKFFLTFLRGTGIINDATITVQKYFTGLGSYQTVGIIKTDSEGESTMWQEVDKTYKYLIVQNGTLLGSVERVSICAATPCSLTIQISEDMPNIFEDYYDYYAENVLSNLSYNSSSKIVTYDFVDISGLANYFQLIVRQSRLNDTGSIICNSTSYSTAGVLTCNLTGYNGDFTATGYVSRSPPKVDKVLGFIVDEDAISSIGVDGILLIMGIIITIVFAAATLSKGSPTTILFFLGLTILGLKIGGLFPFSWIVVVTVEVLILFFISKIKT